MTALALSKEDFDRLRNVSPAFDQACRNLTRERLEQLEQLVTTRHEQAMQWAQEVSRALKTGSQIPPPRLSSFDEPRKNMKGPPLAIWLGILIDGIPESFVIGSGLLVLMQTRVELIDTLRFIEVIPFTLIAGLFLSNFSEALASSANMKLQGWSR